MNSKIEDALQLALLVHSEQVDKVGRPYILHVLRVAARADNDVELVTGLLHDIVEDSCGNVTVEDLADFYPDEVVEAVDALSRRLGERYKDYVQRCSENPLATRIKLYDLMDNLEPGRSNFIGSTSLFKRYTWAKNYLEDVIMSNEEKYV